MCLFAGSVDMMINKELSTLIQIHIFCAFHAFTAVYHVYCQVMEKRGVCELAHFSVICRYKTVKSIKQVFKGIIGM